VRSATTIRIVLGLGLALTSAVASAQNEVAPAAAAPAVDAAPAPDDSDVLVVPEQIVVQKTFTRTEIQRICRKYDGQLIAYYGDVFQVKGCQRLPIINNKTVYEFLRKGRQVTDVDGDVIAAIPEGEPIDQLGGAGRSCRQLEGQYVTYSSGDVYYVEKCKLRVFPDWATYIEHRQKRGNKQGIIESMTWTEFDAFEVGEPIGSVVDDMFAKLLTGFAGVEIIPVDEACEGVNNKVVSYYSRLYRIERCRKREIVAPDLFMKREGKRLAKLKELSSEQWLSLPDGEPIN
jgi:hypothetical protein